MPEPHAFPMLLTDLGILGLVVWAVRKKVR